MQEFLTNFHFLRPLWLLALLVPLFFYWRFYRGINNKSSWENVCDKKLLNYLLIRGSSGQRKLITSLSLTAFIAIILAISGPTWKKQEAPSMAPENPVIILLNMSSDMKKNDLSPSRLERAKFKIIDMMDGLKSAQTGLVVYTNEPFLISPITDDSKIIINLLPAIDYGIMPSNGDRLDRAINFAIEKFNDAGYFNGNIVVFAPDVGQRFDLALEAAQNAKNNKYLVSVINVSKESNEKLKLISTYGGGIYESLSGDDRDINKLDNFINKHISELKLSDNMQLTWIDMGYYLTIIPVICCLYLFRRGIFIILLMLGFASSAQAGWFLNNNQEGYKAFNTGDFETASKKFEEPSWRASAEYRKGNYQDALKYFSQANDVTGLYNQGNALAKGGKIEEAIKKYEEVLKLDSEHEDAKFNLEYLKKQQDQQQNQNNQSQQNQDDNQSNSNQNNKDNQGESSQSPNKPDEKHGDNNQPQNNQQNQDSSQENGDNQQNNEQEQNQNQSPQNSGGQQNSQGKTDNNSSGDQNQENNDSGGGSSGENQSQPENDPNQGNDNAAGNEKDEADEQEKQAGGGEVKPGEEGDNDEEKQARIQQYREIPEDPGGLLKAFIAKEYRLNRYGDE